MGLKFNASRQLISVKNCEKFWLVIQNNNIMKNLKTRLVVYKQLASTDRLKDVKNECFTKLSIR